MMRTRDLLNLRNTGHPGINSLFAKAHSADWDFENDVDWSATVAPDDPLVAHAWAAFGRTPTFQALPEPAKARATRRAVGRMLNILQVGESVAPNVCAILLTVRTISPGSFVSIRIGPPESPTICANSAALPSMSGMPATAPIFPRPRIAEPSVTIATVLGIAV